MELCNPFSLISYSFSRISNRSLGLQFVPSNWTTRSFGLQFVPSNKTIRSLELSCPIRGNELLIRGNERFTYGFFFKSPCPFRAFVEIDYQYFKLHSRFT